MQELKKISLQVAGIVGLMIVVCATEAHTKTPSFVKENFTYNRKIAVDVKALGALTDEVSHYFKTVPTSKYVSVNEGSVFKGVITLEDVQETVDFIAEQVKKNPKQLLHHWFYNHYFDFYRWRTDGCVEKIGCVPRGWPTCPDAIRITQYRIGNIEGSLVKTKKYKVPLYEMPTDELGKKLPYIHANQTEFLRFSHDYSSIMQGALERDARTKILVWVTPEGYQEIAKQGSAWVRIHGCQKPLHLKVAAHNGKKESEKYWFSVVHTEKKKGVSKYPKKVEPIAGVSFAGNIEALGYGKVIVLVGKNHETQEQEMRVGVLVDTGSAFKNNLCQLDLFVGHFSEADHFDKHRRQYPHTAHAYILIKKKKLPKNQKPRA